MSDHALKDTKDKLPLAEFPLSAMEAGMRAFEYGKVKYARFDWLRGHSAIELVSAIIRHAMALQWTSQTAKDSELDHMDHIIANAAMYIEQKRRGTLKRDLITDNKSEAILDPHLTPSDIERALKRYKEKNN